MNVVAGGLGGKQSHEGGWKGKPRYETGEDGGQRELWEASSTTGSQVLPLARGHRLPPGLLKPRCCQEQPALLGIYGSHPHRAGQGKGAPVPSPTSREVGLCR